MKQSKAAMRPPSTLSGGKVQRRRPPLPPLCPILAASCRCDATAQDPMYSPSDTKSRLVQSDLTGRCPSLRLKTHVPPRALLPALPPVLPLRMQVYPRRRHLQLLLPAAP